MNLANKKVLITGASGFIGAHLTHRVFNQGAEVCIITKYNSVIDNIRLVNIWDRIHIIEADLRNVDSLNSIRDFKPDVVFHLAAYNHVGDSFIHISETLNSNILGTANLLEAYGGYEKFVYISTSEIYGYQKEVPFREDFTPCPISPYAIGKYSGELYANMKMKMMDKPIVIIRPFNAFGPYQSPKAIIPEVIIKCLQGKNIETTEGMQTREFNYVSNLVDGFMLAAENNNSVGEIINMGWGGEIRIKDLMLKIHEMTESKSDLQIGKLPHRPTEIWRMCADNTKASKLLNWTPRVTFDEGLLKTIDWYRTYVDEYSNPSSALSKLVQCYD